MHWSVMKDFVVEMVEALRGIVGWEHKGMTT